MTAPEHPRNERRRLPYRAATIRERAATKLYRLDQDRRALAALKIVSGQIRISPGAANMYAFPKG
jgi:hypothetical protein